MSSVRELFNDMRIEVRDTNLQPERAAVILTKVSALLGNIHQEIRERDYEYNLRLLKEYEAEPKANRAKIKADTSAEYTAMREARDLEKDAIELIRSIKYYLKSFEQEFMHTK